MTERITIVTGPIKAGKSVFCDHVQERWGWYHYQVSEHLAHFTNGDDRAALGEIADDLVAEYGPQVWCDMALDAYLRVRKEYPAGVLINGPRRPQEIMHAQELFGASVVFLYATERRRVTRAQYVAKQGDRTFDERSFLQRDRQERLGRTSGGEQGINLRAVQKLPGVLVLDNNAHIDALAA